MWTVRAEFDVSAFILTGECPVASVLESGSALPCSTIVLTSEILPADTYFVFVAPTNYSNVPCGEYTATLEGYPYPDSVRCCYYDSVGFLRCIVTNIQDCLILGGAWTFGVNCFDSCQCPYPNRDYDPFNNNCDTTVIGCPDTLCGEFMVHAVADLDYYQINLTECTRLIVDAFGNDTPFQFAAGKGANTQLSIFHGNCDAIVATDLNSGVGEDARIDICLSPGIYYIRVAPENTPTGPYVLATTCLPCTCSSACEDTCVAAPLNIQCWWPLDETVGTNSNEIVNNRDGTWINSPTPTPGVVGGALHFDGTNWDSIPNHPKVNVALGSFTVDAWIRLAQNVNEPRIIIRKTNNVGVGFILRVLQNRLWGEVADASGTASTPLGSTVFALNQWYFVAMTFRQSLPFDSLKVYINGALEAETQTSLGSLSNTAEFGIAGNSYPGNFRFNGDIDEVEFFRRALREDEIQTIYNAGSNGKCKEYCHLPWDVQYCSGSNTVTVGLTICNYTGTNYVYNWTAFGATPYVWQCPYAPPTIFSPPTGSVAVPSGTCVTVPLAITKPAGIGSTDVSCYFVEITNTTTNDTFCCSGSVWGEDKWCVCGAGAWPLSAIPIPIDRDTTITIGVRNDADASGILNYTLETMSPDPLVNRVSINGLPEGANYTGSLAVPLGDSASLNMSLRFTEAQPLAVYDVLIGWDMNGDNAPEFPFSFAIQSGEDSTQLAIPVVTITRLPGPSHVILYWDAIPDALYYNVYVSNTGPTGPWTLLGTPINHALADLAAINLAKRFYYVTVQY
jgi:hypothetical protein